MENTKHSVFNYFNVFPLFLQVAPWTGRFYSLLDPSYAKNNIPIIASVSEHQPTTWSSFYFDLQMLVFMFPVGLYYCFSKLTDANIFIIIYGVTSIYFAVSLKITLQILILAKMKKHLFWKFASSGRLLFIFCCNPFSLVFAVIYVYFFDNMFEWCISFKDKFKIIFL